MVHHEGQPMPLPRMSITERFAQKVAQAPEKRDGVDDAVNTPEDDKLAAMIKGVNEKVAEPTVESSASEAGAEASPENSETLVHDAEYAKNYAAYMRKKIERAIADREQIEALRTQLRAIPTPNPDIEHASSMHESPFRFDSKAVIDIAGFGPAMILSVNEKTKTAYFTTPEERGNVDAAFRKDENQSSMDAVAGPVIPLSFTEAMDLLKAQQDKARSKIESPVTLEEAANNPLEDRYKAA